jgi:two-component system sensor histidine kinase KdpD
VPGTPLPAGRARARPGDWASALLVVALCTGVSELMLPYFDLADQIMVYLAGVVFIALHYGLAPSLAAVAASVLVFDLMFVPPRWSLNPLNKQHLFTFAVMLVVGTLISRLAAQARAQALLAQARAERAQVLNLLARQLVVARSHEEIAAGLAAAVHSVLARNCALLLPDQTGRLTDAAGFFQDRGLAEWGAAQAAFARDGAAAGEAAANAQQGLYLPLKGTGSTLGVLAIAATQRQLRPEDTDLLNAFADLAALALERSAFEHKSADALVEAERERLRSTLLSGISHDFRTPLTTIVGSATVLLDQDRQLDAGRRSLLAHSILKEARRMHALVSDLLDLTRMEEGGVRPSYEWCPADELLETARLAVEPLTGAHQLRVRTSADAIVWCDPRLIEQALVNLLDNAVRHTPAGTVIEACIAVHESTWDLVVADNGPGLPPGHEQDVFKKFYRGRSQQAGTGTGLGLAICAAVARVHGGTITARNDRGARFVLTLPQPVLAPAEVLE